MVYRAMFFLACCSFAMAQHNDASAERAIPGTPAAEKGPLVDTILTLVGPAKPGPLSESRRFRQYVMAMIGPVPVLGEAAGAGIGQWLDSPPEWGQGWGAYGHRFWSNMAYNSIRQTITYGSAIAFHEDDRYFAATTRGVWPRTKHALLSTFTARGDDGRDRFSISSTAGVLGAGAISSVWGPPSWRGGGNIARNASISFAATAGFNVVREFLPDILRRPRR